MSVLFAAEKVACTAYLQIQGGNAKSRSQLAELTDSSQTLASNFGKSFIGRNEQIGVSAPVASANPSAKLIELSQTVKIGTLDDDGIYPWNIQPIFDDWATPILACGTSFCTMAAAVWIVSTRLCT